MLIGSTFWSEVGSIGGAKEKGDAKVLART